MSKTVYVIGKSGKPLMPTSRNARIRILLKRGLAKPVSTDPFTIQLLYDTPEITQDVTLGIDPGRTNIGLCAIDNDGKPLFAAELETRNKDIPKLMRKRKEHRMARRHAKRRKKRQRRAAKNKTILKSGSVERHLPGYDVDETITCKRIRNKQARFNNRKRPNGWLTPTANQLLQTHVNIVRKLLKFLPITGIRLELNKFAFMVLDDPNIYGADFRNGPLKGYNNDVKQAIYDLQDGKCLLCDNPIEQYHHVIARSENGSETISNRVGLCEACHALVHKDTHAKQALLAKTDGLRKKYGGTSVLNQIMPQLIQELNKIAPVELTSGRDTKAMRDRFDLPKEHYVDTYCIACSDRDPDAIRPPVDYYKIRQFRRHDRQCCQRAMLDRKYMLDGTIIATNRHKTIGQTKPSLEEYVSNGGQTDNLTVKPHNPVMNGMDRYLPGTMLLHNGKAKIVTKRASGSYWFSDGDHVTIRNAIKLKENQGIVFVSNAVS